MPLTLHQARSVAERCVVEAKALGLSQAIAIVDSVGEVILLERMDDTSLGRERLAMGKAYAAVFYRRSTRATLETFKTSPELLQGAQTMFSGRLFVWPGGLPIMQSAELVGGIGVSGATGDQDEQVAIAGLLALEEQ